MNISVSLLFLLSSIFMTTLFFCIGITKMSRTINYIDNLLEKNEKRYRKDKEIKITVRDLTHNAFIEKNISKIKRNYFFSLLSFTTSLIILFSTPNLLNSLFSFGMFLWVILLFFIFSLVYFNNIYKINFFPFTSKKKDKEKMIVLATSELEKKLAFLDKKAKDITEDITYSVKHNAKALGNDLTFYTLLKSLHINERQYKEMNEYISSWIDNKTSNASKSCYDKNKHFEYVADYIMHCDMQIIEDKYLLKETVYSPILAYLIAELNYSKKHKNKKKNRLITTEMYTLINNYDNSIFYSYTNYVYFLSLLNIHDKLSPKLLYQTEYYEYKVIFAFVRAIKNFNKK